MKKRYPTQAEWLAGADLDDGRDDESPQAPDYRDPMEQSADEAHARRRLDLSGESEADDPHGSGE